MFGYIEPDKNELKVADADVYNGYHCGLCKEVGENYGQVGRMWITSDMVFLGLFLGALSPEEDQIDKEHCIMHPLRKRPVEKTSQSIRYAADILMILRGEKFMDDLRDGETSRSKGKMAGVAKKYNKAANLHVDTARAINKAMQELYSYEKNGLSSVKEMCACYGNVMKAIFTGYEDADSQKESVGDFADNLGKLLYLLDISDDFKEDLKERRFNPLADLGIKDREKAMELVRPATDHYYEEMVRAYEGIKLEKNRELVDNIVRSGMKIKIEEIISGK